MYHIETWLAIGPHFHLYNKSNVLTEAQNVAPLNGSWGFSTLTWLTTHWFFKHFLKGCVWSSLLGRHRPEAPDSFPKALLHQSNNGLGENIIIQCKNFKKSLSKHGNLFPLFCNSHGVHYVAPSFLENKVQKIGESLGFISSLPIGDKQMWYTCMLVWADTKLQGAS